jgi:hypothetical protein
MLFVKESDCLQSSANSNIVKALFPQKMIRFFPLEINDGLHGIIERTMHFSRSSKYHSLFPSK